MNTARSLPPEPPARGSFPLDHGGLCKAFMRAYLACAQAHEQAHHLCRDASKEYLQCRMDKCVPALLVLVGARARARRGPSPARSAPRATARPRCAPHLHPLALSCARAACRNLMAQEDLNTLGFDPAVSVVPGAEPVEAAGEVIAGLAAAKRRKMGVLFGIGSGDVKRGGGGH